MKREDYFKYRIQGGDIYVLPVDIFDELFDELVNLQLENKQLLIKNQKRKEGIDKAIKNVEKHLTDNGRFLMLNEWQVPDLLGILKEAE